MKKIFTVFNEQYEVEFENGFEFTFSGKLSNKY